MIAMPRKLTVVTDETPAPLPDPKTIADAIERSERTLLVTVRKSLAASLDAGVPAHAIAPLTRQLLDIDKQIRGIDARAEQEGERGAEVEDGNFDASAV